MFGLIGGFVLPSVIAARGNSTSPFVVSGLFDDAVWDDDYTGTVIASGGGLPYLITGLPMGLSVDNSSGIITISGAPQ